MHRDAHQYLGLGIAAIMAFITSVHMLTAIFMIPIGGFLAVFPDYDIKWGIAHRQSTHTNLLFLFGIPVIFTAFTVLVEYTIQIVLKTSALTGISFDTAEFFTWEALYIFYAYEIAIFSHLFLDMITPMGLSMFGGHVSGSIKSAHPLANRFVETLGIGLLAVGVVGLFGVKYFKVMDADAFYFAIILIISFLVIFVLLGLVVKRPPRSHDIYCGEYDGIYGKIEMCSSAKCIIIDGEQVCFEKQAKGDITLDDNLQKI